MIESSTGGASATFHMLNEKSRRYFKRALVMSGTVYSYFAMTEGNHTQKMRKCAQTWDEKAIILWMKQTDYKTILKCYFENDWGKTLKPEWVPTIEPPHTKGGIITESPDDIWNSAAAPFLDTLFSFTSQVTFNRISFLQENI